MGRTLRGTSMRRACFLPLLVTLIPLSSVMADTSTLLAVLKDKEFPWFGTTYPARCPDHEINFYSCFNPVHDKQESILERAGFGNVEQLKVELKVKFSAEPVLTGICGSFENLPAIKEFELNPGGKIPEEKKKLDAETYRNLPDVSWPAQDLKRHTMIFYDVGFFRIRGWFFNISGSGRELQGWTSVPYSAPANPTVNKNPHLILVFEQSGSTEPPTEEIMLACVETYYSKLTPTACREKVLSILSTGYILIGAQVYYSAGMASSYSRFRSCTESFVCPDECVKPIRDTAMAKLALLPGLTTVGEDNLNFYVNIRFYSIENKNVVVPCCPDPQPLEKFDFRPQITEKPHAPGAHVYPALTGSRMWVELSGPDATYNEMSYYSVMIVDPKGNSDHRAPWGHYFIANFRFPDANLGRKILHAYAPPTPPEGNHTYFIFLFSHNEIITEIPRTTCQTVDPSGRPVSHCWNLNGLPNHFVVRAVSWFDSATDKFTQHYGSTMMGADCSTYPNAIHCDTGREPLERNPPIRIAAMHEILQAAVTAGAALPAATLATQGGGAGAQTGIKPAEPTHPPSVVTLMGSDNETVAVVAEEVTFPITRKQFAAITTKDPLKSIGSGISSRFLSALVNCFLLLMIAHM